MHTTITAVRQRFRRWNTAHTYRKMNAAEVFSKIYAEGHWGYCSERPYYSGDGSLREDIVEPYVRVIREFIQRHRIRKIVDCGCGDFHVSRQFLSADLEYAGIDIVPDLIHYNPVAIWIGINFF